MPRISEKNKLRQIAINNLRTVKKSLPIQTYNKYLKDLSSTNRKDIIAKTNNEIEKSKILVEQNKKLGITKKLTAPIIKKEKAFIVQDTTFATYDNKRQKRLEEAKVLREKIAEEKKKAESIKENKTLKQKLLMDVKKQETVLKKIDKAMVKSEVKKQEKIKQLEEAEKIAKMPEGEEKDKLIKMKKTDDIKFYKRYAFKYNIDYSDNTDDMEKQLYKNIMDANTKVDAQFVIIYLKQKGDNKIYGRTFKIGSIKDYDDFIYRLNTSRNGIKNDKGVGSDAWDIDNLELVYDEFALAITQIGGNGSSDKMMFNVVGIESKKDECGYLSLKECDFEYEGNKRDLINLDKFLEVLQVNDLKINVICNSFLMKRTYREIEKNEKKKMEVDCLNKRTERLTVYKISLEKDIELVYLREVEDAQYTIIYDEFNSHYDVIKNNDIQLCDDVFFSYGSIIKNCKEIFTPRELNVNNHSKPKDKTTLRYLVFDYETVIDFDAKNCMREYSLSVLNLTNEELEALTDADERNDLDTVNAIRQKCCMTFLGFDCSMEFIHWVLENQENNCFIFLGFNNANFDNFILLDKLLSQKTIVDSDGMHVEYRVSDIFYNGSQLLNFHLNGIHNTFDIHKHLMGSLKDNCDSFKINCCAKKSFDHNKAQELYLNGELIEFITDNDELKEYNEFDVLATAVLFCKYRRALSGIEATKKYAKDLHNIKTVGSLIYKVFEDSKRTKNFKLPKLSYKYYDDLQKSKIAGRVELFNGVQKVEERLVSTDVCSLYPYVMSVAPVYYPCGDKIIEVEEYQGDDVLGFYYCDIDQSNLKGMNLPNIYAKKSEIENDWSYQGVLENYLISNVMIGLLKKYNCKVVIKNGFTFPEKKKSCEMFDFLLDFMKAKNEQDTMKKNKNVQYNSALRETLKLLMNSLSGKVIEGLHCEKTVGVETVAEYTKIKDKAQSINFINAIGNKLFITYEVDAEKICQKSQRPIYLGVLIYDYAKRYMFENSYSKVGLDQLLYTDTDASKFRYSKFIAWKQWVDDNNVQVPHWQEVEKIDERYKNHKIFEFGSKVFGAFEDELEEMLGTQYTFYCLEKKSWCYSVDGKSKFRFKGLNENARLLTLEENFIDKRTIHHKAKQDLPAIDETKYFIKPHTQIEVYNWYNENKDLSIGDNTIKFFERIYSTGEAYLLTSSFRKIVKNSAHNVVLGNEDKYNDLMNKIQVNYSMKHINLNKK